MPVEGGTALHITPSHSGPRTFGRCHRLYMGKNLRASLAYDSRTPSQRRAFSQRMIFIMVDVLSPLPFLLSLVVYPFSARRKTPRGSGTQPKTVGRWDSHEDVSRWHNRFSVGLDIFGRIACRGHRRVGWILGPPCAAVFGRTDRRSPGRLELTIGKNRMAHI
ncbi:hypothetical protein EDD85DRAFT_603784 [Armillaria nabsnona]|nr:hypothetical protein EDD85DRAFT_603784 [Armillaria nabsnona]